MAPSAQVSVAQSPVGANMRYANTVLASGRPSMTRFQIVSLQVLGLAAGKQCARMLKPVTVADRWQVLPGCCRGGAEPDPY